VGHVFDDLSKMELSPDLAALGKRAGTPAKVVKGVKPKKDRSQHFSRVPMALWESLGGTPGQTLWLVAYIFYLHWKSNGEPFKLSNGYLKVCGVSASSKLRALRDLEGRGVISVEWRGRKSPIVAVVYRRPR